MKIEVLYFAFARERSGCEREVVELPEDATVGDAAGFLMERHPELAPLRPSLRFARNEAFASAGEPLQDGDTLAVLPPVSGG